MKKRMIFYFILFSYLVFIINSVNANFVCGEVGIDGSTIPSWSNVNIYYSEKPSNFTSCKVSPDNFKYCCDPLEIKTVSWQVGKTINAKVFDIENGYFSNSTSQIISGEGFDVFPKLFVQKAVNLYSPIKGAYFNNRSIILNVSLASIFNELYYNLNSKDYSYNATLCTDCNSADIIFENLSSGEYNLEIIAKNSYLNYSENFNFSMLDYIKFNRTFQCEGCSFERVKSGTEVNVSLNVDLSHYSSGKLIEYIPKEWAVVSDVILEPFSDTHNMLSFDVSGKEININYTLISPNDLISRDYVFQSSFENIYDEEQKVTSSSFWLFDFFSIFKRMSKVDKNLSESMTFIKVNPNEPLVYFPKSAYIEQLVIFTKNYNKNVNFRFDDRFIPSENFDSLTESYKIFSFKTNINEKKITKVSFNFKLNNSEFESPGFYFVNYKNMTLLNYTKYNDDGNFSYYYVENNRTGYYLIIEGSYDE